MANDRVVIEVEPGVFEGILLKPDVPNANGVVYTKEAAEQVMAQMRELVASGRGLVFGGEHRAEPRISDVMARIVGVRDDAHVRIRVVPLTTEKADFAELARSGGLGFNGCFVVDGVGDDKVVRGATLSHVTVCQADDLAPEADVRP